MAKWEGCRCKLYMNFKKQKRQHTKPVISPDCMLLRENDFKAIPHKDCATDASSNFSSDETKSGVNTGCIHEHFCEI